MCHEHFSHTNIYFCPSTFLDMSSHLHTFLIFIYTDHLHIFTSTYAIYASSHLHTSSFYVHIYAYHPHILAPSHLHTFTSSRSVSLSLPPSLPRSLSLSVSDIFTYSRSVTFSFLMKVMQTSVAMLLYALGPSVV